MNLKIVRAFLVVGLTGCGAAELPMDVPNAEPSDLASTKSPVIVGSVNWSSATSLSSTSTERARSKAVGYLSIPAAGTRCTAWLVADDKVITNNHCIGSSADAVGAKVSFNYEDGVASADRIWYDCSTFVKTWTAEDMTVIQCKALNGYLPGQVYGKLTVASGNASNSSAMYIVHQNCDYNATPSCVPTKKYSPGSVLNTNYSSNELSYNADTLGGSSGSPVLGAAGSTYAHQVIGLHHVGVGSNYSSSSYNTGVEASAIKARLATIGL
ncbi:serine protease [Vitiosangium sp. GDMCC 1.1324]|uniref:trypsin-like serine peptidase n=1 Tax=Vitiosangium sp. (strain GDMCC 1.1324) TaxID=2138576 RepID=UPI000D332E0E|nr:trypsin-like peptidase domain-containing protein [Vitiosangium sp. GDMCC 1.1324]PTL85668.1 serine protease [Vitiosangium sp. GDMCC 1.1324]